MRFEEIMAQRWTPALVFVAAVAAPGRVAPQAEPIDRLAAVPSCRMR
jgi:hypothetical protein